MMGPGTVPLKTRFESFSRKLPCGERLSPRMKGKSTAGSGSAHRRSENGAGTRASLSGASNRTTLLIVDLQQRG